MRKIIVALALVSFAPLGCDNTRTEEKKADKGKTAFDLKQGAPKQSQEELEAARKKAGFKSNEEVMEEAKAKYERDSKIYIKERLKDYRKLLDDVRKKLDEIEKAAPKWADKAAAFESWNDKYKKDVSKIIKGYDELTAKGSEGGNTQSILGTAVQAWEDLGRDLGPDISKQEAFATTLAGIRTQLDAVAKELDAIEKDDTLVAEPALGEEGKADEKKADEKKADEKKADEKKADEKKADEKKADEKKAG
jgi:hypothetical protein